MDYAVLIAEIILCAGAITWAAVINVNICKSHHYHCDNCGKDFKPNALKASMFGMNGKTRRVRCPHCGKPERREMLKN